MAASDVVAFGRLRAFHDDRAAGRQQGPVSLMYEPHNPGGGYSAAAPASGTRLVVLFGTATLLIGMALGALVGWVVYRSNAEHSEFMRGCLQDHKKYECVAMWRAGDKNDYPVIVPIPIPMSK